MNTCDGCRFWTEDDYNSGLMAPPDPESPFNVAEPGDWPQFRPCHRIQMPRDEYQEEEYEKAPDGRYICRIPRQAAYVQDGSDYSATLHTRSDFGCTLWEPA